MELTDLIAALSDPAAYPHRPPAVEIRQTHISIVFLAGDQAYKVKKPVDFGFLDFRSLERRRHFCEEEIRLNRRLAPKVYRGVVPITRDKDGRLQIGGPGEVVEWAVEMERLPDDATLRARIARGTAGQAEVEALAARVAAFYAAADSGPTVAAFGRFDVVASNARENFAPAGLLVGKAVSATVFARLQALTESALARLRPLIDARAARGVPRDTHGDLRLDHVYLFPDRAAPGDVVVIDCIEFNERFRYADPVADVAFLVMDLRFHGRDYLAREFAESYFHSSGDAEGRSLLPFYSAYRAAVRGKVDGLRSVETEIASEERALALCSARAHWLLALRELELPDRRPCLVLTTGLPGTGKSTIARGLASASGFCVIRTDEVRKELAGGSGAGAAFGEGIYSPEWTERTYAECLRRAENLLFEGERVLVDAGFRQDARRQLFVEAASRIGVPAVIFRCWAEPTVVRTRLAARRADASDADWRIYEQTAKSWEEHGAATRAFVARLPSGANSNAALARALAVLRGMGLHALPL
jgi:aminoglycoside phosphotransferase family enzyme/predicted kinase